MENKTLRTKSSPQHKYRAFRREKKPENSLAKNTAKCFNAFLSLKKLPNPKFKSIFG